jgi:uncharacterized protein
MAQVSVSSEHAESAAGAHVAPLALTSLAVTTFFLGASQAGLFSATAIIGLVLFFGGLVQLIVGLWEHRSGNAVHAHAFAINGTFWVAYGAAAYLKLLPASGHELSYFFLAWTVLAGIVSLSTTRANLAHVATFALFFLTFLALTIGAFMGANSAFTTIGGWIGIITAIVASYTALASLGSPFALPTWERG